MSHFRTHGYIHTDEFTRLPSDHPYVQTEIQEMADQLEMERRIAGDSTSWVLLKEMFTIPGNRKRALISIGLMVCQQMTGINASFPPLCRLNKLILTPDCRRPSTTMPLKSSKTWGSTTPSRHCLPRGCTVSSRSWRALVSCSLPPTVSVGGKVFCGRVSHRLSLCIWLGFTSVFILRYPGLL